MARWDDLRRAIDASDLEGAEPIWLELVESDPDATDRFLDAAQRMARKQGGRRQAHVLLAMLADALEQSGRDAARLRVLVHLAGVAPDDGKIRQGIVDTARRLHADRPDLDDLLEKSGILSGAAPELAEQASRLLRLLDLAPGAYVFHKAGWGAGKVVDYDPMQGRVVIDFRSKPGHPMDIDAAVDRLERLADDDVRAMAIADPKGLRAFTSEKPLVVLRQVLRRFDGSANLRHVKDALVPDAVATSRWSTWWKEAKKQAQLDPRFHVGGGRDPRIEFHDAAQVDFREQVARTFRGSATHATRQKVAREFLATAGDDPEARAALRELVEAELVGVDRPQLRLGYELILAALDGTDQREILSRMLLATDDPKKLLGSISDDEQRAAAARVLLGAREDGPELVLQAALEDDDPVLGEVGADRFAAAGHPQNLLRLLDQIDARPAQVPSLYAWYVRGLRRQRWDGRSYEAYALVLRVLKVLDAVEYRARRSSALKDRRGVTALADLLARRQGILLKEAADDTDDAGARHLVRLLEKTRGLKARQLQRSQDLVLRAHPGALRERRAAAPGEVEVGERLDQVYMTAGGLERLRAEHDRIANVEIPDNAKEIARAREFGDLSENAEYHAAREKAALLQAKLDALKADLARAVVLTPDVVNTSAVSVGARVLLKDGEGHEWTYALLGPPDIDPGRGIINYLTPLGQALMGRKVGEHVVVEIEDHRRDLEVLAIENAMA